MPKKVGGYDNDGNFVWHFGDRLPAGYSKTNPVVEREEREAREAEEAAQREKEVQERVDAALASKEAEEKPKRTRRTKAQIEADNAAKE